MCNAGNCEFVYEGYLSSDICVCVYQCVSSKHTDPWSAFDRRHLQDAAALECHYANKSYLVWQ